MLKHVFIYFLNNQKLLLLFNQFDVIVGKSLVKHSKMEGTARKKYYQY